ncbi:MAG: S41 family peptidase [Saccharospirillaceae bacterium]|nr:S41 family peptidase [Pseudomonadales bacterium]NRB79369.1 S41 family peptidase [Saccharospirillaceae bacterium]
MNNLNLSTTLRTTLSCLIAFISLNSIADEDSDIDKPYSNLPVEQVSNLAKAFDLIKRNYVEEVDDNTLLKYAIEGMVENLDPHSSYFDTQSLKSFNDSTTGKFTGLGIDITMEDGFVKVISAFDNTPAQKAGLQSGDLIYELDGQLIKGLNLKEASNLMRGEIGTTIEVKVKRPNRKQPITFNITRDEIKNTSVKHYLLTEHIAYTRISSFQVETSNDYTNAILELKKQAPDLKALILDLRNNPGGLLKQAVKISDIFLDEKLVVFTQGREAKSKENHFSTMNTIAKDLKLIVLINPGSASASEIVAGAIQDHQRGIILGQTSFGKASVQQVLYLDETSAIKLTIARYFTPNGTSIQANGIIPDIIVAPSVVSEKSDNNYVSESQLSGHLKGDDNNITTNKYSDNQKNLIDDYQLQQAFQILQGVIILQ